MKLIDKLKEIVINKFKNLTLHYQLKIQCNKKLIKYMKKFKMNHNKEIKMKKVYLEMFQHLLKPPHYSIKIEI